MVLNAKPARVSSVTSQVRASPSGVLPLTGRTGGGR